MDVSKMTLEGFFLTDYERLRKENEELTNKLLATMATPNTFGVFDLGHPTEMVKVTAASSYNYTDKKGITSDALLKVKEMDDEEMWEWATKTYPATNSWYASLQPITVERHKFQYTLRIVETRHDRTFATDGTETEDGSQLVLLRDYEGEECLQVWQMAERMEYIKRQALEYVRDMLDSIIVRLREQEAKEQE